VRSFLLHQARILTSSAEELHGCYCPGQKGPPLDLAKSMHPTFSCWYLWTEQSYLPYCRQGCGP